MASVSVRACLRCHAKKIRCTGYPNCHSCAHAQVHCDKYTRPRKGETLEALALARQRIQWLESEIQTHLDIDCKSIPTGTSLQLLHYASPAARYRASVPTNLQGSRLERQDTGAPEYPSIETIGDSPATNNAPDISLLALNATGEMKYLGPSSGAFFASYATAIVRSFHESQASRRRPFNLALDRASSNGTAASSPEEHRSLSSSDVQFLLKSYQMWVHPLYPLLEPEYLKDLIERCYSHGQISDDLVTKEVNYVDLTIFYLVMALGAVNYDNLMKQQLAQRSPTSKPNPSYLYSMAMRYLDRDPRHLQTRISTIEIVLLISIYSSFGPVGSSQWQLAGLAMRMAIEIGLHHAPKAWQTTMQELDRRNRVFWTAYTIEISLAYNLGRPPSIGEEYITSSLPNSTNETCLAIQHIKHRQIQSRIVSQVYCGTKTAATVSPEEGQRKISKLQRELDEWKAALTSVISPSEMHSPYPFSYWDRLYHGTCFVLHRSSPLCPHPSAHSLEHCIRSAGEYINCMVEVLRNSNVPLSWMLIQGVLFAGLTMLITARTGVSILSRQSGLPFLLVDLPFWTRKCSICLAIMNERWSEELLSKLDIQFEALANDTLKMISSSITTPVRPGAAQPPPADIGTNSTRQPPSALPSLLQQDDSIVAAPSTDFNGTAIGDWDQLQFFREFIGIDGMQTFWDTFPVDMTMNGTEVRSLSDQTVSGNFPTEIREDLFPPW